MITKQQPTGGGGKGGDLSLDPFKPKTLRYETSTEFNK